MINDIKTTVNDKEKEIHKVSLKVKENEDKLKKLLQQRSMLDVGELQKSLQTTSAFAELVQLRIKLSELEDEWGLAIISSQTFSRRGQSSPAAYICT